MLHLRGQKRLEPGLTLDDESSDEDDGHPLHMPVLNGGTASSSAIPLDELSALNGIGSLKLSLKPQQHAAAHASADAAAQHATTAHAAAAYATIAHAAAAHVAAPRPPTIFATGAVAAASAVTASLGGLQPRPLACARAGTSSIVEHMVRLPREAQVGARLALDWDGDWHEGYLAETFTELARDGSSIEVFRVVYDDGLSQVHGRLDDPACSVRLVLAADSSADVVAEDWKQLQLKCVLTHERLVEPAKGALCHHVAQCNLIALRPYAGKTCPCCGERIPRSRDVKLDKNLQMLLETLPESVHAVWIRGSSEVRLEPPSVADHPREQGQSSIDVVDLDEMDEDVLCGSSGGTTMVRTLDEPLRHGTRKRTITDRLAMNPLYAQPVKRKKSSASCSQAASTARPASKVMVVLSEDEHEAEVKAEVEDRRAAEEDTVLAEAQEEEVIAPGPQPLTADEPEEAAEARVVAPQPLTADEARAAAAAEGLELVPSSSGKTGFKGVSKHDNRYQAGIKENGKTRHLGSFATPEEAALCCARHVGAERSAAEVAKARVTVPQPLTADEARAAAAAEGLEPVLSSSSERGFKGVSKDSGRHMARGAEKELGEEDGDEGEEASSNAESEAFDLGAALGYVHGLHPDGDGWIGSVVSVQNSFWPGFSTGRTPATVVAITREPITFADGGSSRAYIIEAEGHHYPIRAVTLMKLPVCCERPLQQQCLSTNAPAIPAEPAIGSRVEVYWPSLQRWQSGRVEAFDWHHLIMYDDGEGRWHTLHQNECGTSTGTAHDAGGDEVYQWRTQSFYGCFCGQTHDELPDGSGVWVQCDECSRWCHGECAGVVSAAAAEALDSFSCPVCLAQAGTVWPSKKAAEAAEARGERPQPLTADEGRAAAAAEGLELVPSSSSETTDSTRACMVCGASPTKGHTCAGGIDPLMVAPGSRVLMPLPRGLLAAAAGMDGFELECPESLGDEVDVVGKATGASGVAHARPVPGPRPPEAAARQQLRHAARGDDDHRRLLTATRLDAGETAEPAIGSRIEVYWPSLDRWQSGRVEAFDWHHLIMYDDGEGRWHTLHQNECAGAYGTSTGTTRDPGRDEVYEWRSLTARRLKSRTGTQERSRGYASRMRLGQDGR